MHSHFCSVDAKLTSVGKIHPSFSTGRKLSTPKTTTATSPTLAMATNRIGAALTALGLNIKPTTSERKNYGYSLKHFDHDEAYDDGEPVPVDDQMYALCPDTYTAIGAHYHFVINAEQGNLFVQSLDVPRYAATRNWDHMPEAKELRHLHATE